MLWRFVWWWWVKGYCVGHVGGGCWLRRRVVMVVVVCWRVCERALEGEGVGGRLARDELPIWKLPLWVVVLCWVERGS